MYNGQMAPGEFGKAYYGILYVTAGMDYKLRSKDIDYKLRLKDMDFKPRFMIWISSESNKCKRYTNGC